MAEAEHGEAVDIALDRAAAGCLGRGAQLTPLRRDVLALVLRAEQPIGAYALLDQLRATRSGAAPPTVYRALDFLLEQGLIHRLERLNAFVACDHRHHGHEHAHDHPHQFLICRRCGASAEICDPGVATAVAAAAAASGFLVQRATVEVEGVCARCAPPPGTPA
jgi:Fur family zinc uptake transcriptional regulator